MKAIRGRFILVLAWATVWFAPGIAAAATSPSAGTEYMQARLVSAVDAVGNLDTAQLGVELTMKPGWKTYWRSPGDAGAPPRLDWDGSSNLADATLSYPAPRLYTLLGLRMEGYSDKVVLPVLARIKTPGQPMALRLTLDALVCAELCVPQTMTLALDLPAGAAVPGKEAQEIARFVSQVPGDGAAAGFTIAPPAEVAHAGGRAIRIEVDAREPFTVPEVLLEVETQASFGAPVIELSQGGRHASAILPMADDVGGSLAGKAMTITVIDGGRAAEVQAVVAGTGAPAAATRGLPAMLALAVLGGFILNLMPCVLPVLSMKLFSVVKSGGAAPARIRAEFLVTAAGIIVSFLVIAAALIALKAAGRTVGWGIQFQQPVFIAVMVMVVTLFACNLLGLFEVVLPSGLTNRLGRPSGGSSLGGSFASGLFATLLATPCSAPFLGTAVAFALSGGPIEIAAVFLALGIGLALPYLAVALRPQVASRMPRPGKWMATLRQVLGGAMALTAVWLLVIAAGQIGVALALSIGGVALAIVAVLALSARFPMGIRQFTPVLVAVLVAMGVAAPLLQGAEATRGPVVAEGSIDWVPFNRDQVRTLVAQGRTVFVDVTADWCLTCQVNARLVLNRQPVAGRVGTTVAMKADWTLPNPGISAFLASHGRFGIPFNVVFGPGAPGGVVLPELLTEGTVLSAIDRAAGPRS